MLEEEDGEIEGIELSFIFSPFYELNLIECIKWRLLADDVQGVMNEMGIFFTLYGLFFYTIYMKSDNAVQ